MFVSLFECEVLYHESTYTLTPNLSAFVWQKFNIIFPKKQKNKINAKPYQNFAVCYSFTILFDFFLGNLDKVFCPLKLTPNLYDSHMLLKDICKFYAIVFHIWNFSSFLISCFCFLFLLFLYVCLWWNPLPYCVHWKNVSFW